MLTDDLQNLKCTKLNYINLLFLKSSLSKNGHKLLLLKENPELFLLNARFECVIPLHKILQCCSFTQGKSQRAFTIWPLFISLTSSSIITSLIPLLPHCPPQFTSQKPRHILNLRALSITYLEHYSPQISIWFIPSRSLGLYSNVFFAVKTILIFLLKNYIPSSPHLYKNSY